MIVYNSMDIQSYDCIQWPHNKNREPLTMTTPKASPQRPEDENLGVAANMAYGLQHVLTMYGGIVAVPLIVGQAAGLSPADIGLLIAASLFAGGLATLLQTLGLPFFGCQFHWCKACRSPVWPPWWRSLAVTERAVYRRSWGR